ncbi:MAG: SIR2 family protein [Thermoleophilia bacterium]
MADRVAMLIGSGVSCAAGLPGTEQITEVVLAERDLPFLFGVESEALTAFMKILTAEIATVNKELARVRSPNYEDIYYLAAQICDSEFGEFENPAADAFARRLARILQKDRSTFATVEPAPGRTPTWQMCVIALAEAAQRLIVGDIRKALSSRDGVDSSKMHVLIDAARTLGDRLDVFTLNHDTLLEEAWVCSGVPFEDGFRPVQEVNAASRLAEHPEVTTWHRDAYLGSRPGPALFKLHGSLDWWRFDNPGVEYLPPTKIDGDPRYIPRREPGPGPFVPPARPEPEILVVRSI